MVMLTTCASVIQDGQEQIAIIVRKLQEFLIPFNGVSYTGTCKLIVTGQSRIRLLL